MTRDLCCWHAGLTAGVGLTVGDAGENTKRLTMVLSPAPSIRQPTAERGASKRNRSKSLVLFVRLRGLRAFVLNRGGV